MTPGKGSDSPESDHSHHSVRHRSPLSGLSDRDQTPVSPRSNRSASDKMSDAARRLSLSIERDFEEGAKLDYEESCKLSAACPPLSGSCKLSAAGPPLSGYDSQSLPDSPPTSGPTSDPTSGSPHSPANSGSPPNGGSPHSPSPMTALKAHDSPQSPEPAAAAAVHNHNESSDSAPTSPLFIYKPGHHHDSPHPQAGLVLPFSPTTENRVSIDLSSSGYDSLDVEPSILASLQSDPGALASCDLTSFSPGWKTVRIDEVAAIEKKVRFLDRVFSTRFFKI